MLSPRFLSSIGLTGYAASPLHGGDINDSFCLTKSSERFFLKLNDAVRYPDMLAKEARALGLLRGKSGLYIPEVIRAGEAEGRQYLLLEWLEAAPADRRSWQQLGEGLAELHRNTQNTFGWEEDNYIGSLPQLNTAAGSWSVFYTEQRILPLVRQLHNSGRFSQADTLLAEKLCGKLHELFPAEPPALLHGDLWSGNYMSTTKGPALFDPAAYYGHREMDLGMSLLFGGFDAVFYDACETAFPLEKDWRKRVPLTQLYPLLVHAGLFGGHYAKAAGEIVKSFV